MIYNIDVSIIHINYVGEWLIGVTILFECVDATIYTAMLTNFYLITIVETTTMKAKLISHFL